MQTSLKLINKKIREWNVSEGYTETQLPFLSVYHTRNNSILMPQHGRPYLFAVIDGFMRLHTPSGILDYNAGQYSISAIDTPSMGRVLAFSEKEDFLAVSIEFYLNDVHEVMIDLDGNLAESILDGTVAERIKDQSDKNVMDSILSLLTAADNEVQRDFMGRHIKREMIFHILCGSSGKQFVQRMVQIQQSGEMYELNSWIKENYRQAFSVEELADRWNMSVPVLHQKFKSAVGMGLLQCQKRLRLTEARRLMLDENKNATEAALDVGYESLSQFTREYKKMFGAAPKEDAKRLKTRFENQANSSEE